MLIPLPLNPLAQAEDNFDDQGSRREPFARGAGVGDDRGTADMARRIRQLEAALQNYRGEGKSSAYANGRRPQEARARLGAAMRRTLAAGQLRAVAVSWGKTDILQFCCRRSRRCGPSRHIPLQLGQLGRINSLGLVEHHLKSYWSSRGGAQLCVIRVVSRGTSAGSARRQDAEKRGSPTRGGVRILRGRCDIR